MTDFKLAIEFNLFELNRITEWLMEIGKNQNLPESLVWDFDFCAQEAVTNIISYVAESAKSYPIELKISIDDKLISLSIRDKGQPFNPLEVPPLELAKGLEDVKIGGMGIHLIRGLMDQCTYSRQNDSNCLVLSAYLPERPEPKALSVKKHENLTSVN